MRSMVGRHSGKVIAQAGPESWLPSSARDWRIFWTVVRWLTVSCRGFGLPGARLQQQPRRGRQRQKPQADKTLTLANFITCRCGHRGSNGRCPAPPRTRSARGPSVNAPLQRSKAPQGRLLVTRARTAHASDCPTQGLLTGPDEICSGYEILLLTRLGWDDKNASSDMATL